VVGRRRSPSPCEPAVRTGYTRYDRVMWVARCADSDWVAEQFAEIIAANWAAEPGPKPQRVGLALAVRARHGDMGEGPGPTSGRVDQPRWRPEGPRWPRERSPPGAHRQAHTASTGLPVPLKTRTSGKDGGVISDKTRVAEALAT
jgi:hypothetical protein